MAFHYYDKIAIFSQIATIKNNKQKFNQVNQPKFYISDFKILF